jgi:hypothetical protein
VPLPSLKAGLNVDLGKSEHSRGFGLTYPVLSGEEKPVRRRKGKPAASEREMGGGGVEKTLEVERKRRREGEGKNRETDRQIDG